MKLEANIPRWALPLLEPKKYKLIKGGRMSGKSHERAEAVVKAMAADPEKKVVCIREIQKSLKFSAKALIEAKIRSLGVSHLFEVLTTEIRRKGGAGICIFQGMQDHTAESIKSLEDFDIAWIEEAQSLSAKSLRLLRPTIVRKKGAEIWATWNPNQPEDAIEKFAKSVANDNSALIIHVNYDQNPFLDDDALEEIEKDKARYPEDFDHVYLGAYDVRSELRVFKHWRVEEIEPEEEEEFYFACDFGFSADPAIMIRTWINEEKRELYIDYEAGDVGIELDHLANEFKKVPRCEEHVIRADSARPETISYLRRNGLPKITAVKKWPGSVHDGVTWLKAWNIVVHPRCSMTQKELRLYSYKTNKAGDILPDLEDKDNHVIDSLRYAYQPLIKKRETEVDIIDPSSTGGGFFESAVVM